MKDENFSIIRNLLEKILSEICELDSWVAFENEGISTDRCSLLEHSGVLKAGASEEQGGAGLDLSRIMDLVGLSGYYACPLPIAETLVSYWIAESVGMELVGASIVTFADDALCELPNLSESGVLNGQAMHVSYGDEASHILVRCRDLEHKNLLVCVRRSDINSSCKVIKNVAGISLASYQFIDTPITTTQVINDNKVFQNLRSIGALMRSHQLAGAMKRAVEITTTYVMERKQFGRPLGKFQAVQQMIAMAAEYAVSSETISHAAAQAKHSQEAVLLIAAAKSWVSDGVKIVTDACHQSHGAMGFTYEYQLHNFTRRLWSWRDEFGTEHEWHRNIGRMAIEAGPEGLWGMITSSNNNQIEAHLQPLVVETVEPRK